MVDLLGGGPSHAGHAVTHDEYRAAARLYGFVREQPHQRPPAPVDPGPQASYEARDKYKDAVRAWQGWEDPRIFMQARVDLNLDRCMMVDGLRIVAWLAKYAEPGEDPLKTVVQMAINSGWDVDPEDCEWAMTDVESTAEDAA